MAILFLLIVLVIFLYQFFYFRSEKFLSIKNSISEYIAECNELNEHINQLRASYTNMHKTDYGEVLYKNVGRYNYKRKGIANAKYAKNIYDCTRQICDGARKQPFKYICKYFNIKANEATLMEFENVLNNFTAAEEGKVLSQRKRENILKSIANDIPWFIKTFFKGKLAKELGFETFVFNSMYYPTYSFRYISSGGNSGSQFSITFDIPMLERFITYLSDQVKFKKSVEGQRKLMTPKLRQYIKERDNFTCKCCNNSIQQEPNLLLEIDHIIPVSKGGITSEENLQTLCWKCNRSKGAKTA